jgi:hypothetical protein
MRIGSVGGLLLLAMMLPDVSVSARDLDFSQREFKATWRQKGTGNKITFHRERQTFSVEFGGKYLSFNTSDATYSRCTEGRDGGANLCVSGRLFDCAFLVTVSTNNEANLDLRRAGGGDDFCRGMSGDYVIVAQ